MTTCTHQDRIHREPIPEAERGNLACEDCLREGTSWVHLRTCLVCGGTRCCDQSPRRHARRHFLSADHPIIASAEPGEPWRYCYIDDTEL